MIDLSMLFAFIFLIFFSEVPSKWYNESTGPLMQEPMEGVGFVIETIEISSVLAVAMGVRLPAQLSPEIITSPGLGGGDLAAGLSSSARLGPSPAILPSCNLQTGQLISDIGSALRSSFMLSPVRVVEPIYACSLQCDQSQLGNLYAVLSKRRGEVLTEDIIEGTSLFLLEATLPVVESFGFAQELLKVIYIT